MNLCIKLILKNMRKNKTRTIVTVSGIVLSTILILSLGFGFSTIRRYRFDKIANEIGSYHVTYHQLPKEDYQKILQNENVEKVRFFKKNSEIKETKFWIYETNGLELSKIHLKEGKYPTKEGQILLPESTQTIYGAIGSTVEIDQHTYQISGFYSEHLLTNPEKKLYTFKETPTEEGLYEYEVTFKNIENLKEQVLALGDLLDLPFSIESKWHEQEEINHDLFVMYGETEELSGIIDTLILVISLSCLSFACILVIYNAFAISVNEQRKFYGMLSSIGITPRKRFFMVLIEATIYAFIAIPIGFLLSIIFMNGFILGLNQILKDVSIIKYHFSCYPLFLLISFGFFIIVIYLAAFIPALEAKKISPIEMMKEIDIIKRKKVRKSIFGIEATLAKKTHFRNKRKYQIVTLSIIFGIVLFLLTASFSKLYYKKTQVKKEMKEPDILLQIKSSEGMEWITEQINQSLKEKEWLREVMPVMLIDSDRKIVAVGLDEKTYKEYQKKLNIKSELPILLNWYSYVEEHNYKIESGKMLKQVPTTISLFYVEISNRNQKKFMDITDFAVTIEPPDGYYLNKKIATLFFKDSDLLELIEKQKIEFTGSYEFQINTKSFVKIEQIVKNFSNQYPNEIIAYQNNALELHREKMNALVQQFIFYGVIVFVMIISITSIMNTLKASMRLRKKEFAILRSIGMSEQSFYKMQLYECLLIGSDAIIIGFLIVAFLLGITNLIMFQLPNFSKTELILPSIKDIFIVIVMVFSSIIFTMLLEVKKLKKINIIDSIKEETF